MSTPRFTPGELTGPQAAALNELARVSEQFSRLTVAPPLSLTRPGGIPAIRLSVDTGMEIFLVEITGHSGTPPVHTGKRKTRDTSNNVIDLSPEVDYSQILNPLETAWDDGTLIAIFPIPEYEDWWWGILIESGSGPTPPATDCQPHGWLSDRQALIDMATATPKKVLTYAVYKAETVSGIAGGRCDQCMQEQGIDPDLIPYPYTAFYDAGKDLWVGSVFIQTCCGCARLEIDIPEENDDAVDDWPPIKATLYLIGGDCDGSGRTSYPMKFQCATATTALFAAGGPALCDGEVIFPCDNVFYVLIQCADCSMVGPDCQYCQEICGPPIMVVTASGFANSYATYNGVWTLTPESSCEWKATCGSLSVTLTITEVSGIVYITVVFAGGGGTVTYKTLGSSDLLICYDTFTPGVQPPDDTNPDVGTVEVSSEFCDQCIQFCDWVIANHPTLHVTFGMDGIGSVACFNGLSFALTWDAVHSWWTSGSFTSSAPCSPTSMGEIRVTCIDFGRLRLVSTFTGPPTPFSCDTQVTRTVSPFLVVLTGGITATITA